MPDKGIPTSTTDVSRIEAPVTWKAYLICAFASVGGIFFGYDSGYINGVTGNPIFIRDIEGPDATSLSGRNQSLIVSILSAGTFFGALAAGDVADIIGRKWTIIVGCFIYIIGMILFRSFGFYSHKLDWRWKMKRGRETFANKRLGCVLQAAMTGLELIVAGRLVAGIGVGFESAIVILYMSEICPRKVRGALVAAYAWCATVGLLLAACVNYASKDLQDSAAYRIPISIQFVWGVLLGGGLLFLPESPRFLVKRGRVSHARDSLARLRGQPADSEYLEAEIAEIVANEEYEAALLPDGGWLSGWLNCFRGSLFKSNSNLRKTILGISVQVLTDSSLRGPKKHANTSPILSF